VVLVLYRQIRASLVSHVADLTAHIERRVPRTLLESVCALRVASEAKIFFLAPGRCFQQLILVSRCVWIMATEAVANRRLMNVPFDLRGVFVGMAGEAELVGSRCDQLHPSDIFVNSNLMTTCTSHRNRRMDRFALGFVGMTLETLRRIGILL
jgi:hypothetical protein